MLITDDLLDCCYPISYAVDAVRVRPSKTVPELEINIPKYAGVLQVDIYTSTVVVVNTPIQSYEGYYNANSDQSLSLNCHVYVHS